MSKPDSSKKLSPEEQKYRDEVLARLEAKHGKEWVESHRDSLDKEFEVFLSSGLL